MKPRRPDQAEKLRQLAAIESNPSAVLDEPAAIVEPALSLPKEGETKPDAVFDHSASDKNEKPIAPIPISNQSLNPPSEEIETDAGSDLIPSLSSLSTNEPIEEIAPDPILSDPSEEEQNFEPFVVAEISETKAGLAPAASLPVASLLNVRRFPMKQSTQVIAITGGKGGVGKSNIACNLAIAMAQMNKRILVFDADLSLANVDVLLGLTPRFNLSHVIRGEKELKEIMIEGPAGVRIIPGGSGVEELSQINPTDMNRLFDAFDDIQPAPDIFLIDTAAGIYPNVMQFLAAADQVIVVTTPEPTAYTDAYALIKTLLKHQDGKEIGLLVNMAQNAREAAEVLRLMLQMCRQFLNLSFNNIGFVPRDPEVLKAVRFQKPFLLRTPNSPASQTLRNIAATILQIELKDKQPRGLRRFFNKMFNHSSAKAAV